MPRDGKQGQCKSSSHPRTSVGQGPEPLRSLHPHTREDAFKAKCHSQGRDRSKCVPLILLVFSENSEGKVHPAGGTKIWAHSWQYSNKTHGHPFMTASPPTSTPPGVTSICINVSWSDLPKTSPPALAQQERAPLRHSVIRDSGLMSVPGES